MALGQNYSIPPSSAVWTSECVKTKLGIFRQRTQKLAMN